VHGRLWITIEALDAANVHQRLVYAPIDCGDESDRVYRTEPAANLHDNQPPRVLTAIVNRERVAAGLPALRGDLRARVAAARRLTEGSDPATSLREAALLPLEQGAVAFHADTLPEAAEILLDEPALRAMLRRRAFSHIGIASRAAADGGLDVTLQLVAIPDAIDERAATAQLFHDLQRAAAPRDLFVSKYLRNLAVWYATQLSHGWNDAAMSDHLTTMLGQTMFRMPKLVVRTVARMADLDPASLVPAHMRWVGVSVVQAPRDGALAGKIFVVLLFAR
jgi:hypothetical protein